MGNSWRANAIGELKRDRETEKEKKKGRDVTDNFHNYLLCCVEEDCFIQAFISFWFACGDNRRSSRRSSGTAVCCVILDHVRGGKKTDFLRII